MHFLILKDRFLLAALLVNNLQSAITVKHIKSALEQSPTNLTEAYTSTFTRIKQQSPYRVKLAFRVLAWLVLSTEPLTVQALRHGLAVEPNTDELDEDNLCSAKILIDCCMGLVVGHHEEAIIRLAHLTVEEFLSESYRGLISDEREKIARACITYLRYQEFQGAPSGSHHELESRKFQFPFLDYAAFNWGLHAVKLESILQEDLLGLLNDRDCVNNAAQLLHYRRRSSHATPEVAFKSAPRVWSALHTIAYWGLDRTLHLLSKEVDNPSLQDSYGCSPLHWAAARGHESTVRELLWAGADIESFDHMPWTPLFWAVIRKQEQVVKTLLFRNVRLDIQDSNGWTPLHYAVSAQDTGIIKRLLKAGVPVDIPNNHGVTPVDLAAQSKNREVLQLLVESESKFSAPREDEIILETAASLGSAASLKQALNALSRKWKHEKSVPLEKLPWALSSKERPAKNLGPFSYGDLSDLPSLEHRILHLAILAEKDSVVQAVICSNLDISVVYDRERTFLHTAAASGGAAVMRLLLAQGLDPKSVDWKGQTALHYAVALGHREIVELLIKCQGVQTILDRDGRPAWHMLWDRKAWGLHPLPKHCSVDFRLWALDTLGIDGANVNAGDKHGTTALHLATLDDDVVIAGRLLELGADPAQQDAKGRQAIHLAASCRKRQTSSTDMLSLFMQRKSIDINALDPYGHSPLSIAFSEGHWEMAYALMELGATVGMPTILRGPLLKAVEKGDLRAIQKMYDAGALPNSPGDVPSLLVFAASHANSLLSATSGSHRPVGKAGSANKELTNKSAAKYSLVVELLLQNGENIDSRDAEGNTALHVALRSNTTMDIVKTLLAHGADIQVSSNSGIRPIHVAAASRHLDYVLMLIERGVDCGAHTARGELPISMAAANGDGFIVEALMNKEALEPSFEKIDWPATVQLARAVANNDDTAIQGLQQKLVHVNGHGQGGQTFLHKAASSGNVEMCATLLYLGADIEARESKAWTPLHKAVAAGHTGAVRFLLENGANLLARTKGTNPNRTQGEPCRALALHLAAWHGHYEVLRTLLDFSTGTMAYDSDSDNTTAPAPPVFDIDATSDDFGRTALMCAASRGYTNIVKLLLAEGADVDANGGYGSWGFCAIDLADESGYDDVVELLADEAVAKGGPLVEWWTTVGAGQALARAEERQALLNA